MRRLVVALTFCFLMFGCAKNISPVFYDVVADHRVLLDETNTAVINSIKADLDDNIDCLDQAQIDSVNNLIYRLEFLKAQGVLIDEYVRSNFANEDLISELLRYRWSGQDTSKK